MTFVLRNNFANKNFSNNCCFFIAPINLSIENIYILFKHTHTQQFQLLRVTIACCIYFLALSFSYFCYSFFKCILRSFFFHTKKCTQQTSSIIFIALCHFMHIMVQFFFIVNKNLCFCIFAKENKAFFVVFLLQWEKSCDRSVFALSLQGSLIIMFAVCFLFLRK